MLQTGDHAAADCCRDGTQAIVLDQTIAMASVDQPVDDLIALELSTGHKLKQRKHGAVECVVARAGRRGGEGCDLIIERGESVGVGLAIQWPDGCERTLRNRRHRLLARKSTSQPGACVGTIEASIQR